MIRDGDREERQHQIIEGLVVAEDVDLGEAKIHRQAPPAAQPVIAAGVTGSSGRR